MKIQTVELKEMQIVEIEGEFQSSYGNVRKYPAFLTNASVKKGFDMGLLESSLFEDLLKLKSLETIISNQKKKQKDNSDDMEDSAKTLAALNEQKLIAVVYLGVLGANKNLNMTFDEFLELYHYELPKTVEMYGKLIVGLVDKSNNFANELGKQAKENKKKHKKHKKQQQKHQD